MKSSRYYNVRMRASEGGAHEEGGKHISGGEKLSSHEQLQENIQFLVDKAFSHSRGTPDFFQLKVEEIHEPISFTPPLQHELHNVSSIPEGRDLTTKILIQCGIAPHVIEKSFEYLQQHFHVRGTIIIDSETGKRIDPYVDRGVRISSFDWHDASYKKWRKRTGHQYNSRMKEALALATKVCSHEKTVAEVCWSDDPDYVTGYVASRTFGYQRISPLKQHGDERGGRILFVKDIEEITTLIHYLEKVPIWIGWEELS